MDFHHQQQIASFLHDLMDLDVDNFISSPSSEYTTNSVADSQTDASSCDMEIDDPDKNQLTNSSNLQANGCCSLNASHFHNQFAMSPNASSTVSSPASTLSSLTYSTPAAHSTSSDSTSTPSPSPTTFPSFPLLPPEVRLTIFAHASPPPHTLLPRQYNGRFHMKPSERWTYQRAPPALLHVCQESRLEFSTGYDEDVAVKSAQRGHPVYKLCLFNKLDPPTWFCAVYDSVGGCLEVISKIAIRRELRHITVAPDYFSTTSPLWAIPTLERYDIATSCFAQFTLLQNLTIEIALSTMTSYVDIHRQLSFKREIWSPKRRAYMSLAKRYGNTPLGNTVRFFSKHFSDVAALEPDFRLRVLEFRALPAMKEINADLKSFSIKLDPNASFVEDLSEFF